MLLRRMHRTIGICLLLPCCGWVVTGLVFFLKPGYASAFARLEPKCYPLAAEAVSPAQIDWLEYRVLKTALGIHLLVRDEQGWRHLRAADGKAWPAPNEADVRRLVEDAVAGRRGRYGRIIQIAGDQIFMDSGVRIVLDWPRLALRQEGGDTRLINTLYKLHYLQWTGNATLDRALGIAGLGLLAAMTVTGCVLLFAGRRRLAP